MLVMALSTAGMEFTGDIPRLELAAKVTPKAMTNRPST